MQNYRVKKGYDYSMKKRLIITVLFLTALILSCSTVLAEDNFFSKTYEIKSKVVIAGKSSEKPDKPAVLLLIKSDADESDIKNEDIIYINQTITNGSGEFVFEFEFDGFTYEDGVVANCKALVNIDGDVSTPSITKSEVLSDFITFDIGFANDGVFSKIKNLYNLKNWRYNIIIGFYSDTGELLKVLTEYKDLQDNNKMPFFDIPNGTAKIKGFL